MAMLNAQIVTRPSALILMQPLDFGPRENGVHNAAMQATERLRGLSAGAIRIDRASIECKVPLQTLQGVPDQRRFTIPWCRSARWLGACKKKCQNFPLLLPHISFRLSKPKRCNALSRRQTGHSKSNGRMDLVVGPKRKSLHRP